MLMIPKRPLRFFVMTLAFPAALCGCPCNGDERLATLTQLGDVEYAVVGDWNFEGTLSKAAPGDVTWTLEGSFLFPSSGFRVAPPNVTIRESFPEQVEVRISVTPPTGGALTVLTPAPVLRRFFASDQAVIDVVIVTCE